MSTPHSGRPTVPGRTGLAHVVERDRGRGLGQPVPLVHLGAERRVRTPPAPPPAARRRRRRRTAGAVGRRCWAGRLDQPDVHRRHRGEHVAPCGDHQRERLDRVEPGQQHDGRAPPERGVHHRDLAERVEQRQPAEHDVVAHACRTGRSAATLTCSMIAEVRADRTLGPAGGAAGVEDRRGADRVHRLVPDDRGRRRRPRPRGAGTGPRPSVGHQDREQRDPGRAAAGAASASIGAAATAGRRRESRSTNSISSALNSRWTGTTTAPSARTP